MIENAAQTEDGEQAVGATLSSGLATGAMLLVGGAMLVQLIAAAMGLLIARTLGPGEYGEYTLAFALAGVISGLAIFGLDSVVAREAAQRPTEMGAVVLGALYPAMFLALIAVGAVYIAGLLLGYTADMRLLLLIAGLIMGVKNIVVVARAFFRGWVRMDLDVATQVIEALAALGFVALAMFTVRSAVGASLGVAAAELLALVFAVTLAWKLSGNHHRWNVRLSLDIVRSAAPLGIAFALIGLGLRFDMLLLSAFRPTLEVGLYGAAFGIMLMSRPMSYVSVSLLPRFAGLVAGEPFQFTQLWVKGLRFTLLSALPIGVGTSLLASMLLRLLYGPAFVGGVVALRILGLVACILFINTYLWNVLIACKSERAITIAALFGVATTAILGFLFMPRWGIEGAAIAALGRECAQLAVLGFFMSKHVTVPTRNLAKLVWPPILAAVAFAAVLGPVRDQQGFNALLVLPLATFVYVLVLWLTKALNQDDVHHLYAALLAFIPWRSRSERIVKGEINDF